MFIALPGLFNSGFVAPGRETPMTQLFVLLSVSQVTGPLEPTTLENVAVLVL